MKKRNQTRYMGRGGRLSASSPPPDSHGDHRTRAYGFNTRAVVVSTYAHISDQPTFSIEDENGIVVAVEPEDRAVAIYCDVITYGSAYGNSGGPLRRVPVLLPSAGLHEGRIWKPRPSKIDFEELNLDVYKANLSDLDGDHVLIQFLEDDISQPFIAGRIPHPQMGRGNEDLESPGHRMRLGDDDGVDLQKHRGSYWGVNAAGDFEVDATRAHDGEFLIDGTEVPAEGANNGNVTIRANKNAKITLIGASSDQETPAPTYELVLESNKLTVKLNDGASLDIQGADGNAVTVLGDGGVHAVIAEQLQSWIDTQLKPYLDTHIHPSGMGPTGPPSVATPFPAPSYPAAATSSKLKFPDG